MPDQRYSFHFNRPLEHLPVWLTQLQAEHGFTDTILFGDTRPVHQAALPVLRQAGVKIHVYEEGYLRPDWITLERDGVNGYSKYCGQSTAFWLDPPVQTTETNPSIHSGKTFGVRALYDLTYRLANAALKPRYKHYQTHRPLNAALEYAGWALRMPTNKLWRQHRDSYRIHQLVKHQRPFYLLPLQLDSDAQIRVHSPFSSVQQVIQQVMHSFAEQAPATSYLVIKNHPLDTGLLGHSHYVKRLARRLGLGKRVIFLETGHLPTLLQHTKGTIVVNSTTATSALHHGSPTLALGTALFNMAGLTFQHGLDRFWQEGCPADQTIYRHFQRTLIALTQINGDFYTRQGMRLAVAGSLQRLAIEPATKATSQKAAEPVTSDLLPTDGLLPASAYAYKTH